MNKADMINEFMDEMDELSADGKQDVLAYLEILNGKTPTNPLAALRLNRSLIKAQKKGLQIPAGTMLTLAGVALNIIDGVADLADRRILMSYYWHAEDVHSKEIPDVLTRNSFDPA